MVGGPGPGQSLQRGTPLRLPSVKLHRRGLAVLQEPEQQRAGLQALHHVSPACVRPDIMGRSLRSLAAVLERGSGLWYIRPAALDVTAPPCCVEPIFSLTLRAALLKLLNLLMASDCGCRCVCGLSQRHGCDLFWKRPHRKTVYWTVGRRLNHHCVS